MKLLESSEGSIPKAQLRAIREDLAAIGAVEAAGFMLLVPKPPEPVEWQGFKLWIASDVGLLIYEATAGWSEPHVTPEGRRDAWRLTGSLKLWLQFADLSVSLATAWDERRGARRAQRAISGGQSFLHLPEPPAEWSPPGSDRKAWQDFVRACIQLSARTTSPV